MRLIACISALLLVSSGCAQLPERVRIDVDGRTMELRRQGPSPLSQWTKWSSSPDCSTRERVDPIDYATSVLLAPDRMEVTSKDGRSGSLYRCLK
jgi:hypothetical protein